MKILFCFILLFANLAFSATEKVLFTANINLQDKESLINGFKAFNDYCSGCHSTELQRYNRVMKDFGIEDLKTINENVKETDQITSNINKKSANVWFGVVPPDLTLTAKYKSKDWIYSYLKSFYEDKSRVFGVNNLTYPNTAMPNILENLEGIKIRKNANENILFKTVAGEYSNQDFDKMILDITNFLVYSSEPIQIKRRSMGKFVLLFLSIFTLLAWMLKQEFWKDVK